MDLLNVAVTVGVSAVGAFLAAWWGVRFSAERMRKELIVSKQAEWYETVIPLLRGQAALMRSSARLDESFRAIGYEKDAIPRQREFLDRTATVLEQHRLYGSSSTVAMVQEAMNVGTRVLFLANPHNFPNNSAEVGVGDALAMVGELMDALAGEVENDFRRHIGLDPLVGRNDLKARISELRSCIEGAYDSTKRQWAHYEEDSELAVEVSEDAGASWSEVHCGGPLAIRVRELGTDRPPGWRTVYDPFGLQAWEWPPSETPGT